MFRDLIEIFGSSASNREFVHEITHYFIKYILFYQKYDNLHVKSEEHGRLHLTNETVESDSWFTSHVCDTYHIKHQMKYFICKKCSKVVTLQRRNVSRQIV